MAIVVNKRPNDRCWSGNPIHYLLYSAAAEADATNYFEIRVKFKRTDEAAYSNIVTLPYKPVSGTAKVDIQDILDGLMEHELPYLPTSTSWPSPNFSNKATGLFYIEFREITTAAPDPAWDTTESAEECFVIKGGISFEKWRGDNYWVNYFDVVLPFLSWQESGRLHSEDELMWLSWLNLNDDIVESEIKVQLTVTFTDGSEDVSELDCAVPLNNIAYFPCGYEQLQLGDIDNTKVVHYWELQVVKVSTNPTEPLSQVFRIYLDNRNDYNAVNLHYRNSLGGIDSARVRGVIEFNSQREFSQIEKIVLHDYFTGININGRVSADNSTELLVYKGDIGHLGKEEQDRLRDLHLKREVWWGKQEKWLPVMLLTSSQRLRMSTDKLFSMPLEFCIASGGNYYYTPENVNLQDGNITTGLVCTAVINTLSSSYSAGVGWTVSWVLASGSPVKYFVSTPAVSGGAPHETTSTSYLFPWLPVGDNVVTVQPVCYIGGVYYLGAAETITVTVAEVCVGVGISGEPIYLPDAVELVPYNYVLNLTGTAPFNVTNIVKPSWMSIAVVGSTVEITGTPGVSDSGTGITVSFDLDNCSGGNTDSYSDVIDVFNAVANGAFTITNDASGMNFIKNVFPNNPAFYTISTGTIPTLAGTSAVGVLTDGIATAISVFVIISSPLYAIQLIKNGVLQEQVDVPGSGTYSFAAVSFLVTDSMEIKLVAS